MPKTFKDEIHQIVADQTDRVRQSATGATGENPHAALVGDIDALRDRYVGAGAALNVLSLTPLPSRDGSLLDAQTPDELSTALQTLEVVRLAVLWATGTAAAEPVAQMRSVAARRLEQSAA